MPLDSKMGEIREYEDDIRDFFGDNIIEVRLDATDDRVCDFCVTNEALAHYDGEQKKLICLGNCYVTERGLMCQSCRDKLKGIPTLVYFKTGEEYFDAYY